MKLWPEFSGMKFWKMSFNQKADVVYWILGILPFVILKTKCASWAEAD